MFPFRRTTRQLPLWTRVWRVADLSSVPWPDMDLFPPRFQPPTTLQLPLKKVETTIVLLLYYRYFSVSVKHGISGLNNCRRGKRVFHPDSDGPRHTPTLNTSSKTDVQYVVRPVGLPRPTGPFKVWSGWSRRYATALSRCRVPPWTSTFHHETMGYRDPLVVSGN